MTWLAWQAGTVTVPSGTVTFLFTDIEGSTRLWQQDEAAMRAALERHDDILRSAIAGSWRVCVLHRWGRVRGSLRHGG